MKIVIASDLHISKKIKRIDQVLSLAENADILCMTGDIVNDGVSEQFMRVKEVIEQADENSFRKPILTVCGNHDYLLEKVTCREDKENFVKECKNRSVFSEQELRSLFRNKGYRTIIKILFLEGFDNKVNLATLRNNGILSEDEAPRINTMISKTNFEKLKHLGRRDK